ncbi:hypothetical protein U91I_03879 [alpha proteobacterium U9-1i]|nr:hypothetical protein U91I_03879 [alpha proteobacterium U9-1i]
MRIDLVFLTLAAAFMVVGVGLGMHMGMSQDFSLSPVHAHINLIGWASLALYGLTYRAYPQLQRGWLAMAQLGFSGLGGVLFPIGLYMVLTGGAEQPVLAASVLWLIGALIFLGRLVGLWFNKEPQAV